MSVVAGSLLLAAPVAFAAGAVSFVSPCVLPLVPGYLSYVGGMSGAERAGAGRARRAAGRATRELAAEPARPADRPRSGVPVGVSAPVATFAGAGGVAVTAPAPARVEAPPSALPGGDAARPTGGGTLRSRTFLGAVLFVAGFSAVFIAGGALFGGLGSSLIAHHLGLQRALGAVTILLGLAFAGALSRIPLVNREFRLHRLPGAGLVGAPVLGMLFGLGWAPCVGPTLGTVLTLAASDSTGTATRGAVLTAFYCAGLGLPFLFVAVAFHRAMNVLAVFRRHARAVMTLGGLLLVGIGVLELTGTWNSWILQLQTSTGGFTPSL